MITKVKQNFTSLIFNVLDGNMFSKMCKPRKFFIAHTFWLFASIKGRINFLQLGRFSKFCEQYFRIGFQKNFDFLSFNSILLQKHLSNSTVFAIALAPSYIDKSDKITSGLLTSLGMTHRVLWVMVSVMLLSNINLDNIRLLNKKKDLPLQNDSNK